MFFEDIDNSLPVNGLLHGILVNWQKGEQDDEIELVLKKSVKFKEGATEL